MTLLRSHIYSWELMCSNVWGGDLVRGRAVAWERLHTRRHVVCVDNHPRLYWNPLLRNMELPAGERGVFGDFIISKALWHDQVNRRKPDHFGLIFCNCYCTEGSERRHCLYLRSRNRKPLIWFFKKSIEMHKWCFIFCSQSKSQCETIQILLLTE